MSDLTARWHDAVSTHVLMPVLRWQQALRPNRRAFRLAYRAARRFRAATPAWSDDHKRDWILGQLRRQVRRAATDTPYYRDLFDRIGFDPRADFSFDDFARLPPLERADVQQHGGAMLSTRVPANQLRRNATGGSTGMPTEVWLGPEESAWSHSGRQHFMSSIGLPPGSRTAMLWGHHLDPVTSDRWNDRAVALAYNTRWLDCFRLSEDRLDAIHRQLARHRPACIVAYASALGHLAGRILESGDTPNYPTRCSITGAEKLMPVHRDAIERAFGRPVHEQYGSRDVGSIGFQLTPGESLAYTIDWANVLVEPETDGADSAILVTKLHADGMPMIRYRIGDVGRFTTAQHPGQPALTLAEVVGRQTDRIWLHGRRWIHGAQLPHLLKDFPVREFMLVQHRDYSVDLQIVPRVGFDDDSRRRIHAAMTANLPGVEVRLEAVDAIPRTRANKWQIVVSEVAVENVVA